MKLIKIRGRYTEPPKDVEPTPQAGRRDGQVKTFPIDAAIDPTTEYMVEPELWWNDKNRVATTGDVIEGMATSKQWFRLYGPRQSGKTTSLLQAMETLQRKDKYVCIYWSLEGMGAPKEAGPTNYKLQEQFDLRLLGRFAARVKVTQEDGYLTDEFDAFEEFDELYGKNVYSMPAFAFVHSWNVWQNLFKRTRTKH